MTELTDEALMFTYKFKEEAEQVQPSVSVAIAAYTTAHARLVLYKYLKQLQERVLYFDTDSIIFISKNSDQNPETGDYLGDLTDEIAEYGDGAYICSFVTAGPKNYA